MLQKATILTFATAIVLMSGCQSSDDSASRDSPTWIALPKGIDPRALPGGVSGAAKLYQNERLLAEQPLQIGESSASASFPGLIPGQFTVVISFTSRLDGTVLARSSKSVNWSGGTGQLDFKQADFEYPDDDGDQFSNLAEITEQTAVDNPASKPDVAKVFVTSLFGVPNFSLWSEAGGKSGLAAADSICQARARSAGLTGTYVAWLSDSNNDAYCRVLGLSGKRGDASCSETLLGDRKVGPWIRTDGHPVFLSYARGFNLETTEMLVPVNHDENGADAGGANLLVWTGSDDSGRYALSHGSCNDWTSADAARTAAWGLGSGTSGSWTTANSSSCGNETYGRLYCFDVSAKAQTLPEYKQHNSRLAFLSSEFGYGNLSAWNHAKGLSGVAAADAVCQSLATSAGFRNPGTYKAWLSDDAFSAASRIKSNGPWSRPDGVLVARDKSALLGGRLFSPVSLTEQGRYFASAWAWTGTLGRGVIAAGANCGNWTSASPTLLGKRGDSSVTLGEWTDADGWYTASCDRLLRLYCFEDE